VALNVGADDGNYRVREVAETVGEVTGCRVSILGAHDPDARSYRVSFARIRELLPDFRPVWNVRAGAEELFAAYRRHGLTRELFERSFTRLARIDTLLQEGAIDADLRPRLERV
jgi:hypothetical protein